VWKRHTKDRLAIILEDRERDSSRGDSEREEKKEKKNKQIETLV
jgi:hypothetical protein